MHNTAATNITTTLLDALLAEAPVLVRTRQLLPALDWRRARPDQVGELISRLAAARMKIPQWLAQDLLAAGHTLPEDSLPIDASELRLLSALNTLPSASDAVASLGRETESIGSIEQISAKVVQQLIVRLLALGQTNAAVKMALDAQAAAPEVLRPVKAHLDPYLASLPDVRVRVCGTSSTQTLAGALRYSFGANGFHAAISEADYGTLMTELMAPREPADLLVILLDQHYFMLQDWRREPEQFFSDLEERLATLMDALRSYCARTGSPVIVTTLPAVASPSAGYMDRTFPTGSARICARVNLALSELAQDAPLVCLLDADQALAALSSHMRADQKLWFYGRFAYSEPAVRSLAAGIGRLWRARSKGTAKVLALDFDNTLWGGVYGDDGLAKLQCGDDFPGSAYKAFQQECLRLKSQGMILVGLSKNNADALSVFDTHPGVLLKSNDFVATSVNWEPKPDKIRKLAADLRLGLDAFVFVDDSPHERAAMRRMCPEVLVPEVPADPAARPEWLRALPYTWPVRITSEDAKRSSFYAAEVKHRELRASSVDYDEYLTSLDQRLVLQPLTAAILPRVAQLHQRTNQFNLTNQRFSEAELGQFCGQDPCRLAYAGNVKDRFGDHGLVVAATAEIEGDEATIRSFVMSCRVIGRRVEHAFLAAVLESLQDRGVRVVNGLFKPTEKNAIASKLYADFGFIGTGAANGIHTSRMEIADLVPMPHIAALNVQWSGNNACA